MDFQEYQQLVTRTVPADGMSDTDLLQNFTLGLAGESGEFANLVKKAQFHGHPIQQEVLIDELGDCLWYLTALAQVLGEDLEVVASRNIQKLRKRYPAGFDKQRSVNRTE